MRAVAVSAGEADSVRLVEAAEPREGAGECLVRVLDVGIDGTDREIVGGEYGEAPEGESQLILGHECLGIVEQGGGSLSPGTLVVPTVRRPCPQRCPNCAAGEQDFCSTGDYRERGIKGAHGFMCDRFVERPEHLVAVPEELRGVGVLAEPLAILERSYRLVLELQQRLVWEPRRVLVTGAGNMGTMASLLGRLHGLDVLVYSQGPKRGAAGDIIDAIGCDYADSEAESLVEAAGRLGAPDIVIEATGFSPLAWDAVGVLAVNGIACLLSVTQGDLRTEIPSDDLNAALVLGNRLMFGSVNAHRQDYERAVEDLAGIDEQWPGLLARFITHRFPLDRYAEALAGNDGELKTVLEVSS